MIVFPIFCYLLIHIYLEKRREVSEFKDMYVFSSALATKCFFTMVKPNHTAVDYESFISLDLQRHPILSVFLFHLVWWFVLHIF